MQAMKNPLILTTGTFEPGQAEAFCGREPDERRRALARAELCYHRGELTAASASFTALCECEDPQVTLAARLGLALTSLSSGDFLEILNSYQLLLSAEGGELDDFLIYANIMLHNFSEIRFPPVGVDAFNVEDPLKPMAIYTYAHYLLETGDVGRAVGMAEGALIFMHGPSPISEIYLSLIICRGYMLRKLWDKAEYFFRYAWKLAEPDGLLMPFAEHRGLLFGMLERCLRYEHSAEYKRISELSNRFQSGWVTVHNALTGEHVSDALTAIEFNVASLAAKGSSNTEIADLLGVSVNSVRAHLRNIFNKLGVSSRKELNGFVL